MPHLHKNRIHVGCSKFHGSMLSLKFYFCCAVISLWLEVGTIIIFLVVGEIYGLEDKWRDVVRLEKICGPIIEVYVMAIK